MSKKTEQEFQDLLKELKVGHAKLSQAWGTSISESSNKIENNYLAPKAGTAGIFQNPSFPARRQIPNGSIPSAGVSSSPINPSLSVNPNSQWVQAYGLEEAIRKIALLEEQVEIMKEQFDLLMDAFEYLQMMKG